MRSAWLSRRRRHGSHNPASLPTPVAKRMFRAAETMRTEALQGDIRYALRLFLDIVRRSHCASLVRRARERLLLMLIQGGAGRHGVSSSATSSLLQQHLRAGAFVCRLADDVLHYRRPAVPPAPVPPPATSMPPAATVHAIDGALPAGMLRALQAAFAPGSPFWKAHRYRCGLQRSAFFSYVHRLDSTPRIGFDRVLAALLAHVQSHFPQARGARFAEWCGPVPAVCTVLASPPPPAAVSPPCGVSPPLKQVGPLPAARRRPSASLRLGRRGAWRRAQPARL